MSLKRRRPLNMRSTSEHKGGRKGESRFERFFSNILGGEFLTRKSARPRFFYVFFVLILVSIIVISEQQIRQKQRRITELENTYKSEITKLKANNQFIPYEKNKILINRMEERGFVTDEKQIFTVRETPKKAKKRRWFRRKEAADGK